MKPKHYTQEDLKPTDVKPPRSSGVRLDFKTGQYRPTVDGVDLPISTFCRDRALAIAKAQVGTES